MSAHPPPLPLSLTELRDWRKAKLALLVARLVTALASNNLQELVDVIAIFVRYFKALMTAVEKLTIRHKQIRASDTPSVWTHPVTLKRLQ